MEFKNLMHISGKPGLFELVGNRPNGVIAKSIENKITQFYSNRIHQFTPLDSIEMYTTEDNVSLKKVMLMAKASKAVAPTNTDDAAKLSAYFKEVLPTYDEDKVKVSDIKKFVKWFNICNTLEITDWNDTVEEVSNATAPIEEAVVVEEEKKAEKPAKKTATKKAKAVAATEENKEEKSTKAPKAAKKAAK